MVELESHNYNKKIFKEFSESLVSYVKNTFITEEMLMEPLYKKITIDKNMKVYDFFPYNDIRVECYCKECNTKRIFAFEDSNIANLSFLSDSAPGPINNSSYTTPKNTIGDKLKGIDFFTFCAMADCRHKMIIHFMKIDENAIMKIGQFPSIYDLNENINNKKFLKTLDKEYADYYKKACSLYSFSSYIGALIYLRRIFEKLLIDTFTDNNDRITISFDEFKNEKMKNKIKILKPYLPTVMFQQGFNTIYTKISDGVHNLTEDECSKMFLVLKMGIEEILTEKLEKEEKSQRIQELTKELQNL